MKTTDNFKKAIEKHLNALAQKDEQFAIVYAKPNKNIDDCVKFILNSVKASGCNGFDDDEIYGIAVHYYEEDVLDEKYLKDIRCNVVVNHSPVLTEEDKAELEAKAKKDYYDECFRKQLTQNAPKKKAKAQDTQLSLFG